MIKKKKKKNRILITLCAMFLAVASVFAFIPFTRNDTKVVKADTVYNNYYSSDLILPLSYYDKVSDDVYSQTNTNIFAFFATNFYNSPDGIHLSISTSANVPDNLWNHSFTSDYVIKEIGVENTFYHTLINNYNGQVKYSLFSVRVNSLDFNCVPLYFTITSSYYYNQGMNTITYYDKNGNFLVINAVFFYDPNYPDPMDKFFLSNRTYYLTNSFTDNEMYNAGYSSGLNNGYNSGLNEGTSKGYEEGYSAGNIVGYNNGYTAGTEATNQYTFLNLISATIDAPIKYFQSLFNFELLGVNLQGFLTGLFTLCVIVTIIKVAL